MGRLPGAGGAGSGERAVSLRARQPSTAGRVDLELVGAGEAGLERLVGLLLDGLYLLFHRGLELLRVRGGQPRRGTGVASTASASDWSDRPSFHSEATAHSELPIDAAWL